MPIRVAGAGNARQSQALVARKPDPNAHGSLAGIVATPSCVAVPIRQHGGTSLPVVAALWRPAPVS